MGSFDKLKYILKERDDFLLICHISPDGDAIGSMVALGEALTEKGKKVTLICKDPVPEVFQFAVDGIKIQSELPQDFGAVILLDNGELKRTGFPEEIFKISKSDVPVVNIDHHQKNDLWRTVNVNLANPEASSTSEIIFLLCQSLKYHVSSKMATALMLGIYNDTGGFQHSNTTPAVLEIASLLLSYGANLKKISNNISYTKPTEGLKLWGKALNRTKIIEKYKMAVSVLTQEDIVQAGAQEEDASGLSNFLNTIPGVQVAILLYETSDGKIKGSLRTESNKIDVSKLANLLCGGGLKKAAGFCIDGRIKLDGDIWKIE